MYNMILYPKSYAAFMQFLHFLTLFAFTNHRIPQLPQDSCLHLILNDKGFLSGVDIQSTAPHSPVGHTQIK